MSLVVNVAKTFGTYCVADTLSNFIQHPTQKMDYGILNTYLDRPVDQKFWGTRTEHIIGVAAALAVTDHASQAVCASYLGKPLCFARSPATFVAHTFFFIFAGVTAYVAADAAFNPLIKEEKKMDALMSGTYSSAIGRLHNKSLGFYLHFQDEKDHLKIVAPNNFVNLIVFYCKPVGSCTAWFEPYVAPVLAKVAGPAIAGSWVGSSLLPATLAYSTVKGKLERISNDILMDFYFLHCFFF